MENKLTKIISQELKPDYVLTEFENGLILPMSYRIDEKGEEYVEMLPEPVNLDEILKERNGK